MLPSVLDPVLTAAAIYGPVVLFAVFLLEGALIGKLIPTRALFVAVALAVGTSLFSLATVALAAIAGATVGQCLLFVLVRRTDYEPGTAAGRGTLTTGAVDRARALLTRWGLPAVMVTNTLPVVRGSLTVPTALGTASAPRFSAYSFLGTAIYVTALTAIATGVGQAATALL